MAPRSNKKGKPKRHQSLVRGRDLSRRNGFREPNKTILIVCEDAKSSPDYFERLRKKLSLKPVTVEICGKECGTDPKGVVDCAVQKRKDAEKSPVKDGYDKVFCVVDIDKHRNMGDAIQRARDNTIDLIISNPCFEYWYILHFKRTGEVYNNHHQPQKDFQAILRGQYNNPRYKYEKCGCEFFEIIYPETKDAIKNAKSILKSQHHGESDLSKCNPSTHVYKVVESMQEMASSTE